MFLPKMFQIPQMFLPKIFQIPQMFLPKIFQIPQMVKTEEIYTDTSFSGKPNERFWHENALFLEKKVRKSAFSCHFKESIVNSEVTLDNLFQE